MTAQHAPWSAELSTFETHAKAWLVALFGIPPAAVLVALESAGITLPTWATALLALLPILAATSGVVFGPANKTVLDTTYAATLVSAPAPLTPLLRMPGADAPVQQGPTLQSGETGTLQDPPADQPSPDVPPSVAG